MLPQWFSVVCLSTLPHVYRDPAAWSRKPLATLNEKANTMYSSAALSKARRLALFEKRYGAMTFCNAGFRQWIVLELGVDNVHANALINLGNG